MRVRVYEIKNCSQYTQHIVTDKLVQVIFRFFRKRNLDTIVWMVIFSTETKRHTTFLDKFIISKHSTFHVTSYSDSSFIVIKRRSKFTFREVAHSEFI